jgi:hypothetical protein
MVPQSVQFIDHLLRALDTDLVKGWDASAGAGLGFFRKP